MPKHVNFEQHSVEISQWLQEQKPIDWIVRKLKCSRDTFKKKFPTYTGNQGWRINKTAPIITREKICKCGKKFVVSGTAGSYRLKQKTCSSNCGHSRQEYWDENAKQYKTIARKYHSLKCVFCGFDIIVAIHHYDENHKNNKPENLVPLCPNHHSMIHNRRFKHIVQPIVDKYVKEFKMGQWQKSDAPALQAASSGGGTHLCPPI